MGIGAAVMAYKKAKVLAPTVIYAVLVLMICLFTIFAIIFPKFEELQHLLDKLNAKTRELLSGIKVIKAFEKEEYFKDKFDEVIVPPVFYNDFKIIKVITKNFISISYDERKLFNHSIHLHQYDLL